MAPALSPPFASRELNGEILLDELQRLRLAAVPQRDLIDCATEVSRLRGLPLAEVPGRFQALAHQRFGATPEIAGLLVRWAQKVRSEPDLAALCGHFRRLALTSAMLNAVYRAGTRLRRGAR